MKKLLSLIPILLLVFVLIGCKPKTYNMVDLSNYSFDEVIEWASENNKLHKLQLRYAPSTEVAKNKFLSQSPSKDETYNDDTIFIVTFSLGENENSFNTNLYTEVPDLTGKTLDQALALLKDADLRIGTISLTNTSKGDYIVQSSNPIKGNNVKEGTSISIFISKK